MNSLHVIVGIDFSNAFNSIHRSVIAKEVRDKFPQVTSWFDLCYGKPSKLLVKGGDPVSSERGGAIPWTPFFFAVALQPTVIKAGAKCHGLSRRRI